MSTLRITSGDTYEDDRRLIVTVTDPDGDATDLTGVDLTFMAKRVRTDADADAAITKQTPTDIEVASPSSGIARIELTSADTEDLAGKYVWELEADDAVGKVTLASGLLYVTGDLIE